MSNKTAPTILLASASSRRFDLLRQINIVPEPVLAADIDETPLHGELPQNLAKRLSQGKAAAFRDQYPDHFILAADTVVACGKNILDKAENAEQAAVFLKKLSGRRHHVHGGITLITPDGRQLTRHCRTLVQFKPLSDREIEDYIASKEWEGKAGGYAIQGTAAAFVKYLAGSYSNVVGLSLYDTMKILDSGGFKTAP
ncbi:MAG TPA: Maf family protein [Alphaproteobacteria bacterium]|nr:Maf family protein [Alphaproteobacteria bacterium]